MSEKQHFKNNTSSSLVVCSCTFRHLSCLHKNDQQIAITGNWQCQTCWVYFVFQRFCIDLFEKRFYSWGKNSTELITFQEILFWFDLLGGVFTWERFYSQQNLVKTEISSFCCLLNHLRVRFFFFKFLTHIIIIINYWQRDKNWPTVTVFPVTVFKESNIKCVLFVQHLPWRCKFVVT